MSDASVSRSARRVRGSARARRAASISGLRTVLAFCLLFTSTFQSFVAQAHLHVPPRLASDSVTVSFDSQPQASALPGEREDRDKRSRGDNSTNCPLCQALAFSGAPLAHCAPTTLLPVLAATIVAVDREPVASIAAVSYSWTGRGPPLS